MCVITVIGLGLIALNKTPIEFLPKLDAPFVTVFIPYPGATPAQVEKEVAIPAEGEFRTIPGLSQIFSNSDGSGCMIHLLFSWDTDMGIATAEARDRIERLKLVLPQEIERVYLRRDSSDMIPIMVVALADTGDIDDESFAHLVRTVVQPKIKRINGVADVEIQGPPEESVLIEFDQNALRRQNLGLYDVMSALQTSSFNVAVGDIQDGRQKHYVRVLGEFSRPENLASLIVGPHGLRLKDVAEVGFGKRETDYRFSIDRKQQTVLMIRKESQANTVATCEALKEELDKLKEDPQLAGIQPTIFFDQSRVILGAVTGLLEAGQYGGLMALIVLFLFLRKFRPTVVVALAIPSSLVVAFVFMFFAGMSINLITMMSLIVSIGMLVDNSIVVMENIYRKRELGEDARSSAVSGAKEVGLAITASTLTTVVVFAPVLYVEAGELNTYMRQFAIPVCVALVASLVIALTVIPLAVANVKERNTSRFSDWMRPVTQRLPEFVRRAQPFRALLDGYTWVLALSQRWRLAVLIIIGFIGYATVNIPMQRVGVQGMPDVDLRQVTFNIRLDQNYDMAMAEDLFLKLEDLVDSYRDELGIKNVFVFHRADQGELSLYLKQASEYEEDEEVQYSSEDVVDFFQAKIPEHLPGARVRISTGEQNIGASGTGGAGGRVSVRIRGDDIDVLKQYAGRLEDLMEALPGVSDVNTNYDDPRREIQLRVDDTRAANMGISPMIIAQTVSFAIQGSGMVPDIKQRGREIPVWTQFREEDRERRENLEQVSLIANSGDLVPLNRVTDFVKSNSPQAIIRVNGKNYIWLSARTGGGNLAGVKREIESIIDTFDLPPGYDIQLGDKLLEVEANFGSFLTTLLLAIILIYLVMSALFESFLTPLSILTTVPLAYVGVYWGMYLMSTPLDTVAFIGCILMVGIVVNNGIVIIDHINQLRREGMERYEAIVQAGRHRFRPVLMTALTTILGALPLALGGGAAEVTLPSLGRALISGLTTGTILTLFIVPLFYSLIDDFQRNVLGFFAGLMSLRQSPVREA